MLSGKAWAAIRMVTENDPGGLFQPSNICPKTGRMVLDVLCDNHPNAVVPLPEGFDVHPEPHDHQDMPISICVVLQLYSLHCSISAPPILTPSAT